MGKVATSPLPSRGSPPLHSGGQNQKWPTCGQIGYVTPAVSGIPTASEWGEGKSEVAQLWAKWLHHPCRLGDPHRYRAGGESKVAHFWGKCLRHPCRLGDPHRCRVRGEIRSGPLVGKVATSPLPSRGSPPLQSGGGSLKWPTCGQSGYVTLAVSGIPTAAERGGNQKWPTCGQTARLWAKWLRHPCRLGDPHRFRAGGGGGDQKWPTCGQTAYITPAVSGIPTAAERGGGNQKWPSCGQIGYVSPAVSGIPTAAERGRKSEVAHLWAKWLGHPCRLGDPHRCRAGGQIRSGPLVGQEAMSPLPSRGSPPLQSGGGNQKWPTCGQIVYATPAVSGIPTAAERGGEIRSGPLVGKVATSPLPSRGSPPLQSAGKNVGKVATSPLLSRGPRRCRAGGGGMRSGPVVGKVATSPLPSRGSPPLHSGGGGGSEVDHLWAKWLHHPCRLGDPQRCTAGGGSLKWPTCGQSGYVTPAVSGIPTASERAGKSEVAHLWAKWLRHPCRLGDPHRCRAGGQIRSGPLVGKVATSPLPSRESPPLQSGGRENQKWPSCGQSGYITPAVSGIPTASERGGKSEVAHLWAKWLHHPCRLGDPHRCTAGGQIRSGPVVGKVATSPLPSGIPNASERGGEIRSGRRGSPTLQSGGGNQKWPTCGQSGYVTPAVSGIPTAAERGGKSEVAHLWAKWLHHPCRLGDPHRFRAGGKIRSGPLVGKVATSPLPSRGSPPLHSGGANQKWPTCGQSGYVTPAVSRIPTASEWGEGKSEVAQLWAKWLHRPCRLGDPHRFRAGGEIRSGPLVGKVATSPLPSRGSPPLHSGGANQKWPGCGQSGYVTPAVSGIPNASERGGKSEVADLWAEWLCHPCRLGDPHRCRAGGKSEVAHLWAKWLHHPCRLGDPHRFRAGGKIRSGPLVGKLATSPLPSRGSPPLHSGGANQKWPTCGQSGYVTPAVSGIPTASEWGEGKSEVAQLWAKWLHHPCRLGDPHRCRAGEKIRSGPLVGKMATSPLPSRGSPPLHGGGGGGEKWPTCGQSGYVTPAVSGIPTAAELGAKSEVAHLWAKWLRQPCCIGDPHRCRAGGGSLKWPSCGQSGYITPAVSGIPTASERGGKSEVADLWAEWLRHPCRLGEPHRCRAGGEV